RSPNSSVSCGAGWHPARRLRIAARADWQSARSLASCPTKHFQKVEAFGLGDRFLPVLTDLPQISAVDPALQPIPAFPAGIPPRSTPCPHHPADAAFDKEPRRTRADRRASPDPAAARRHDLPAAPRRERSDRAV